MALLRDMWCKVAQERDELYQTCVVGIESQVEWGRRRRREGHLIS